MDRWHPLDEARGTVDTNVAFYAGPEGSRAYVLATRVEQGAVGSRAAWTAVQDLWFAGFSLRISAPRTRPESVAPERAIRGCDELEWTWGGEWLDGFRAGITQCNVGHEFILLTFVSNELARAPANLQRIGS